MIDESGSEEGLERRREALHAALLEYAATVADAEEDLDENLEAACLEALGIPRGAARRVEPGSLLSRGRRDPEPGRAAGSP
jgi:hypothetical protein